MEMPLTVKITRYSVFILALFIMFCGVTLLVHPPVALCYMAIGFDFAILGYGLGRGRFRRLTLISITAYFVITVAMSYLAGGLISTSPISITLCLIILLICFVMLSSKDSRDYLDRGRSGKIRLGNFASILPKKDSPDRDSHSPLESDGMDDGTHSSDVTMPLWDGQYTGQVMSGPDGVDIAQGIGTFKNSVVEYNGSWNNGLPDGQGIETTSDSVTEGTWKGGVRSGMFTITSGSEVKRGLFVNGEMDGVWTSSSGAVETWDKGRLLDPRDDTSRSRLSESVEQNGEDEGDATPVPITRSDVDDDAGFGFMICVQCGANLTGIVGEACNCPQCGARFR